MCVSSIRYRHQTNVSVHRQTKTRVNKCKVELKNDIVRGVVCTVVQEVKRFYCLFDLIKLPIMVRFQNIVSHTIITTTTTTTTTIIIVLLLSVILLL